MTESPHLIAGSEAPGPNGNRRERRKIALRARILEIASQRFDAQGVHATKISEICELADIAQKTFFNHFPSKQHLLRAMSEDAMEQLLERIEEVRKHPGTTRERIARFFDGFAEAAETAGPMHRELLTELIHAMHDTPFEAQRVRRLHDAFDALVDDGVAQGELTSEHPSEILAELVLGAFYSLIFNHSHREDYPLRRNAAAAAKLLADALEARPEQA